MNKKELQSLRLDRARELAIQQSIETGVSYLYYLRQDGEYRTSVARVEAPYCQLWEIYQGGILTNCDAEYKRTFWKIYPPLVQPQISFPSLHPKFPRRSLR